MTQTQKIAWPTILAEAAAIIVSILLAFAIDAWWDARADRQAEQSAIKRLIVEFDYNLELLQESKERHRRTLAATEQLLTLTGPNRKGVNDLAGIARLLIDCFQNPTFDPRLGTTNSLIASGDLDLLRDEELQGLLTEWPTLVHDMLEWQIIERRHGEEIILPFTYDYVAWPSVLVELGLEERRSAFDSDFNALLSQLRFEGMLVNRRYNVRELLADIDRLEAKTVQLLDKLRDQGGG